MHTTIEIPDQLLKQMSTLIEQEGISRDELISRALSDYLKRHEASNADTAFGLWSKNPQDGLKNQEFLRSEWVNESAFDTSQCKSSERSRLSAVSLR